jgi:hypothetical protein
MFRIRLTFSSSRDVELFRVDCVDGERSPVTCIRGKTNGAYRGAGTFQWSSAVRAAACVFLKSKVLSDLPPGEPMLSGEALSLAASLDYAITKQPAWIVDMFGVSSSGQSMARRLFRVTNSHRKRGGPVSISLNILKCPPPCVEVVLDGRTVNDPDQLRDILRRIETYPSDRHLQEAQITTRLEERVMSSEPATTNTPKRIQRAA